MAFINWLSNLGEKSSRTDVWVILYTLVMLTSAVFFFGCGAGLFENCSTSFITANTVVLSTCITGIMVDLGIKRWKETAVDLEDLARTIIDKYKTLN